MTIKVLHVIARLNVGGTASYLNNLIQSSQSLDIEHLVIFGCVQGEEVEDQRSAQIPHIRVRFLGRRISPVNDIRSWWALVKILREYRPNLINSHTFKAGLLVRLLPTKIPIVHTFHGHLLDDPEFSRLQKRIIVRIERLLARRAKVLTVTGENVRKELATVRIRHSRWVCIVPGIKDMVKIERHSALNLLGVEDVSRYKLIIGWHSRFAPVKNVPLVMTVAKQNQDCLFLMSGGGPLFIKFKTEHPQNVRMLGWQSPEVLFSSCDVVLSTSHNEGLPFSLIEASLMSLPCIATNVGGTSEIVLHDKTGYIVNPDSEDISEKIAFLKNDVKLRVGMGNNARAYALKHFGFEIFAEKYKTLVEDTIN